MDCKARYISLASKIAPYRNSHYFKTAFDSKLGTLFEVQGLYLKFNNPPAKAGVV